LVYFDLIENFIYLWGGCLVSDQYYFVSDLHGSVSRYEKLFSVIRNEKPNVLFIGGDILPSGLKSIASGTNDFLKDIIIKGFSKLRSELRSEYPEIYIILGNDDGKFSEEKINKAASKGLWSYIHNKKVEYDGYSIYGYSFIPPTPFLMKDWEKYDVSRYTEPGCISPEDGKRTYEIEPNLIKYATIKKDLETLFGNDDMSKSVILFHSPPYKTKLDRAALDGKYIDSAPLDVHVGSIAIREFIEEKKPILTLHGHIHESPGITGSWKDKIGNTLMFSAAHDGPELSLIKFNINKPGSAVRLLL